MKNSQPKFDFKNGELTATSDYSSQAILVDDGRIGEYYECISYDEMDKLCEAWLEFRKTKT